MQKRLKQPGKFSQTLKERFEEKFYVTPGCWEWTATKSAKGYGQIRWKYEPMIASRVAYALYVGPIPDGLLVRHKCDNPGCVNPEHLELGTSADNSADMVKRGRHHTAKQKVV